MRDQVHLFDNLDGGSSSSWMAEQCHDRKSGYNVRCWLFPGTQRRLLSSSSTSSPDHFQPKPSHSRCAPPRKAPADTPLTKMEEKSPEYRILSFTTSNERDKRQWFSLEIQVLASRYRITVSPSNFRNSPIRSHEFQKYFAFLRSQHNNDDDNDSCGEADEEEHASRGPTMYDCFDWAATPCLANLSASHLRYCRSRTP